MRNVGQDQQRFRTRVQTRGGVWKAGRVVCGIACSLRLAVERGMMSGLTGTTGSSKTGATSCTSSCARWRCWRALNAAAARSALALVRSLRVAAAVADDAASDGGSRRGCGENVSMLGEHTCSSSHTGTIRLTALAEAAATGWATGFVGRVGFGPEGATVLPPAGTTLMAAPTEGAPGGVRKSSTRCGGGDGMRGRSVLAGRRRGAGDGECGGVPGGSTRWRFAGGAFS
jgi:hypothetical protein